jgi:hypothetical protein
VAALPANGLRQVVVDDVTVALNRNCAALAREAAAVPRAFLAPGREGGGADGDGGRVVGGRGQPRVEPGAVGGGVRAEDCDAVPAPLPVGAGGRDDGLRRRPVADLGTAPRGAQLVVVEGVILVGSRQHGPVEEHAKILGGTAAGPGAGCRFLRHRGIGAYIPAKTDQDANRRKLGWKGSRPLTFDPELDQGRRNVNVLLTVWMRH